MTITLSIPHLLGTAVAASKDESRYYLNGVYIEVRSTGVVYAATDGMLLTVCRTQPEEAPTETGDYIVPLDVIATVKKWKSKSATATLALRGDGKAEITDGVNVAVFNFVEGTFPDFRRVIPRGFTPSMPSRLDGAVLMRAQEFFKIVCGLNWGDRDSIPTVHWNGKSGSSIVTYGEREALAVFTPMKNGTDAVPTLGWL